MKNSLLILFALPVLAAAQQRLTPATALARRAGELTDAQALDRATAFLGLVGELGVDRRGFRYYIDRPFGDLPERAYEIDYGSHHLEVDTKTGQVKVYWLSVYAFTHPANPRAAALLAAPTATEARTIVDRTARAVGLPPAARLVHFAVRDRNPKADADTRGFIAAIYVGSDNSQLHLVFDRRSGRLENLIRTPPRAALPFPRSAEMKDGLGFPPPAGVKRRP